MALLLLNDAKREMERLGMADAPEVALLEPAIAMNSPVFVLGGKNDGYRIEDREGGLRRRRRFDSSSGSCLYTVFCLYSDPRIQTKSR